MENVFLYHTSESPPGGIYRCHFVGLNSFKAFREVYMAAGSYPQENIYLLQHVFNNWFQTLSVDKMAAASVMLAFVIAIFVLLLERSWEREG